jgi:hypothetical protein
VFVWACPGKVAELQQGCNTVLGSVSGNLKHTTAEARCYARCWHLGLLLLSDYTAKPIVQREHDSSHQLCDTCLVHLLTDCCASTHTWHGTFIPETHFLSRFASCIVAQATSQPLHLLKSCSDVACSCDGRAGRSCCPTGLSCGLEDPALEDSTHAGTVVRGNYQYRKISWKDIWKDML